MTETADPIRIPIGRNITYAVRGMPDVPNQYGPGYLAPTEISLTYRATEDSQLGRFHAYVKGHWLRDGEEVATDQKLPGQHYYGDPSTWPDWLAEEARLHDPAAAPHQPRRTPMTDPTPARERLLDAISFAEAANQGTTPNELIDGFAHELAEQQRQFAEKRYTEDQPPIPYAGYLGMLDAADGIDPEARS